jgi:hypothetical protein
MADKQRQHYVPKFYLKNFSFQNNLKEIGVFNIAKDFFIQNGKLKTQCYKPFFYGKDGELENLLSELESLMSPLIKNILTSNKLPIKNSSEHHTLLYFMLLTEIRNPMASKAIQESQDHILYHLNEFGETKSSDFQYDFPKVSQEEMIKITFSSLEKSFAITQDLNYKLILNSTNTPFITSDNPLVKYNQYLEYRKSLMGKTGYATTGIQLFLPLNPQTMILFYDSNIYKVGDKKKNYINIDSQNDVDQLNLLQFLNCEENLYFNYGISLNYLRALKNDSLKYSKGNTTNSRVLDRINEKGEKMEARSVIWLSPSNIDISLSISDILLTKKAKESEFKITEPQIRPRAISILNQYRR